MNYATKLSLPGARRQLEELQRRSFALGHAAGALEFDSVTLAPPANRVARSHTLAVLGEAQLELVSSAEGIRLLDFLTDNIDALSYAERRAVHLLRRSGEILRHVQLEEYLAFRKLANEATNAWAAANERGEFALLEPWLGRLFAAARRIANQVMPDRSASDFWLDYNEEGLTEALCGEYFSRLEAATGSIARRARSLASETGALGGIRVTPLTQQRLARAVMAELGVDMNRCRLSVSDRPFTVAFSRYDVRVCASYDPEDFTTGLYGVMHECGHALYELGTAPELQFTVLGAGVSMAVHESQSRLFENMIGRSMAWTEHLWPRLVSQIPELDRLTPEEYYRAVNSAKLTPLRACADEFAYCGHIRLRWELERELLEGRLHIHDAPAAWNELTRKYLGCEVKSDREGILQDAHWAAGQIGYFPAYALGTLAAAQLMAEIRAEADVDERLREGDISPVSGWLRENIWRHGSLYAPGELMHRALGGDVETKYYADYLSDKLESVYGVREC